MDANKARGMPGVRLFLAAGDITELGPMPCVAVPEGVDVPVPIYPVLAREEVRHVGDAVAFVVAQTLDQARDAAEAVELDWEPLPPAIGVDAALKPGAPLVWADRPGNLAFETT